MTYIGRFAPSPTGRLHLGSLIGALASYLDARANGGVWLVRMEDLDPPREVPGAARDILQSLQDHGLSWDGDVMWQSHRHTAYREAMERLLSQQRAFYCTCSRTELAAGGGVHRGLCRDNREQPAEEYAVRCRVEDTEIGFNDAIQGYYAQNLLRESGDFVLRRKDGFYAYQLAVVVDDAAQGVSHVVRGSDLLDSTPRQIWLQQQLGLPQPGYAHVPVVTNDQGQKLSKQTFARELLSRDARDNLVQALRFLQQPVPDITASLKDLLAAAVQQWNPGLIPRAMQIAEHSIATET